MYQTQHLTPDQRRAVYEEELAGMERLHLRALIRARYALAFGPGMWDTERGEEMIEAVRSEMNASKEEEEPCP